MDQQGLCAQQMEEMEPSLRWVGRVVLSKILHFFMSSDIHCIV